MEIKHINIKGYEGLYDIYEDGSIMSLRKNKFLKPVIKTPYNYIYNFLTPNNGKGKWFYIHRLVAHHWIGECPKSKEVNHKDHNKLNNHYSNLEYVTHSENILKSFRDNGRLSYWAMYPELRKPHGLETMLKIANAKIKECYLFDIHKSVNYKFKSIKDLLEYVGVNRTSYQRHKKNKTSCKKRYMFSDHPLFSCTTLNKT